MKVLVIVDMQNDFIRGALGSEEAVAIVESVANKIETCDEKTLVLFTQDTHQEDYLTTQEGRNLPVEHCIEGTKGWEVDERIMSAFNSNKIIPKLRLKDSVYNTFQKDTFGSLELAETIEKYTHCIESIELCGLCLDICVITNAVLLKTHLPEVCISIDTKCCASTSKSAHESAKILMKSLQIGDSSE